jgi:hypothetical protein
MVSATCPKCKIVLVEANSQNMADLGASVVIAHKARANQIGNSYGLNEYQASDSNYDIPNTIIVAASGDGGWWSGPIAPCTYSSVVCVGGTSVWSYADSRGWLETAWSAAGSGCSQLVIEPAWQPKNLCAGSKRAEADISAIADPISPGVVVYLGAGTGWTPGYYGFGGTSVSTQIINGIYALAGNAAQLHAGWSTWANPQYINDVTIGGNGAIGNSLTGAYTNSVGQACTPVSVCYSTPGWDGPTGNGTPNGIGAF